MKRCLKPQDIEGLVRGMFSGRRATSARRHIDGCEACAAALADAQANETWLRRLDDGGELAELRRRLAAAPVSQTTEALTDAPRE